MKLKLNPVRYLLEASAWCWRTIPSCITAGKLADLVVLGRDPIERTTVGGRWVYES